MNSADNPITRLEDAIIAALRDVEIDGVKVFQDEPTLKIRSAVGNDDNVIAELLAEVTGAPQMRVRWSAWAGMEELAATGGGAGSIRGWAEQSGVIQFDVFLCCQAPRSAVESKGGALGVVGYQDLVIAILEQLQPVAVGMNKARHAAINASGVRLLYFGKIEIMSWLENGAVLKLRLMAVLDSAV